jgi:hypothetical protein
MTKDLAEFKFRRLGKHFMKLKDYDEIPLCKTHLSEVRDYWPNKPVGDAQRIRKWSLCMVRLVHPPTDTDTD